MSEQQLRNNGIKYNYPSCCIDQFIKNDYTNINLNESWSFSSETGFLMCDKHLEETIKKYKKEDNFRNYCIENYKILTTTISLV